MDSEGLKILASVPRYGVNRRILRPNEEISVLRSSFYEDFESQSPQSCTFELQHPKHMSGKLSNKDISFVCSFEARSLLVTSLLDYPRLVW